MGRVTVIHRELGPGAVGHEEGGLGVLGDTLEGCKHAVTLTGDKAEGPGVHEDQAEGAGVHGDEEEGAGVHGECAEGPQKTPDF